MRSLTWLTILGARSCQLVKNSVVLWTGWSSTQVTSVFSWFFLFCSPFLIICTGANRLGKTEKRKWKAKKQSCSQAGSKRLENLLPALIHQLNFLIIFALTFCSCSCQLHAALFAQLLGRGIFSSRLYKSSIFESRHLPSPTAAACVYWYVFIIELVLIKTEVN